MPRAQPPRGPISVCFPEALMIKTEDTSRGLRGERMCSGGWGVCVLVSLYVVFYTMLLSDGQDLITVIHANKGDTVVDDPGCAQSFSTPPLSRVVSGRAN